MKTPAHQTATGRTIWSSQHFLPGLAAVGGFENAALVIVIPHMAGCTHQDGIAILGIDENLGDVLAVFKSDVGPVLATVSRLVHSVANRDTVTRPGLARSDPNCFRV